jgi:hypothetical protein
MMILPYICHQNNVLTFRYVKSKRREEKKRTENRRKRRDQKRREVKTRE